MICWWRIYLKTDQFHKYDQRKGYSQISEYTNHCSNCILSTSIFDWFIIAVKSLSKSMAILVMEFLSLTTGFWGKQAWRPPSKWNTMFFFAFSKRNQLALGLKEMGKFLFEGRQKTKLRQPIGQTFFPTFPKEFSHFLQT